MQRYAKVGVTYFQLMSFNGISLKCESYSDIDPINLFKNYIVFLERVLEEIREY
jgi:hypothetical protein